MAALHDLEAFAGTSDATDPLSPLEEQSEMNRRTAFVDIAVDFVLRELLAGQVDVGIGSPILLRGPELLNALFTQACRRRFPLYQTLTGTAKWQELLSNYREAVRSDRLTLAQRQGREKIVMPKAEMYKVLFGQMSTAAGDSFIKKLGPLVETKGNPKLFSLRLAMHSAEDELINYLKRFSQHRPVPVNAAVEFLRHQGYIETETEEIVEILITREYLTRDSDEDIRVIQSPEVERDLLLEKIAEMNRELCRLEVIKPDSLSSETSIVDLQKHLALLEARLKERVEAQIKELENSIISFQDLIGTVRASTVPKNWASSKLSTHLTGIATKLLQTQDPLLKSLRKELKRVEKELDSSSGPADVEWAVVLREKRVSFFNAFQNLQERVTQFETRVKALNSWEVLNSQLRSTDALCALVIDTEPGLSQALNQLVDEFQERFATDSWGPLSISSEFSKKLGTIQSNVQGLLYSYTQTFNRELEEIRNRFNALLPSTPLPVFDVSVNGDPQADSIHKSFQKLYQWTFEGFRTSVTDCQEKRKNGDHWRDPDNGRRSWKKLEEQVEAGLQKAEGMLDFETVQSIGATVLLMQSGFLSEKKDENILGLYNNPDHSPDFKKLEKLFMKGHIQIRVERKNLNP